MEDQIKINAIESLERLLIGRSSNEDKDGPFSSEQKKTIVDKIVELVGSLKV